MVNGLSFNPGLDCPQAEESTKWVFLPTLCEFPDHWVVEREEPPSPWKKGFKRKGLTCMVERPALAYLQSSATDPEWEVHVPGILRQSEPARSLFKVLIAQTTHCELITSEISWVHISFEYKKQKRKGAWSSLIPFSVMTGCSQFFLVFISLGSCIISIVSIWSQKA